MTAALPAWLRPRTRRRTRGPGPVVLDRRRIYILPTGAGLVFALICLAMLIGATNYGNNLVYALTFLLTAVGLVSMLHTWRNLAGLAVGAGRCEPVFAGGTCCFPIRLGNTDRRQRYGVVVKSGTHLPIAIDIPAGQDGGCLLELPAERRGWRALGRVTVYTEYPLGLFHAWSHIDLAEARCLVFPAPAPGAPLPELSGAGALPDSRAGAGGDDFAGLRPYQAGDSLRQVHWKALAHGHELTVKRFGGESGIELWLAWETLPGLDPEARLSLLCRWVLDAEAAGARYGLRLPDRRLPLDRGPAHREACLTALALFGASE